MNNELMVSTAGGYMYFKTNQMTADKAFDEFLESLESAGINADNMNFAELELRNEKEETISYFPYIPDKQENMEL